MLWVTRSHVHVDRVACPWRISRFVDSDAKFLFVPKNQVEKAAADTGAIPFDAPELSQAIVTTSVPSKQSSKNMN